MYENATKEELIDKIQQLERHVVQLKNVISKLQTGGSSRVQHPQRPFDFTKYNTRHVALKIAYLGWDYQGFAVQEDTERTVEAALFDALLKTRLIESRDTCNYHRCGRTDKGVSAFSQVISIDLRTNLSHGVGVKCRKDESGNNDHSNEMDESTAEQASEPHTGSDVEEIRYVYILNRVLPAEIRILAWSPVPHGFSARFSCTSRSYKYFFPRGNLDLSRMLESANALIGEHDFRNLCKMDVANGVVAYRRRITAVTLKVCSHISHTCTTEDRIASESVVSTNNSLNADSSRDCIAGKVAAENVGCRSVEEGHLSGGDGYDICELTITGQAFLWHQIRCIMSVLFLIGQGRENPSVISELLDVECHPRKPQYTMSVEFPLVLFDCVYDNDIDWQRDVDSDLDIVRSLQSTWTQHSVRAAMLRRMLSELGGSNSTQCQTDCLIPGARSRVYKPLFERELCESLEDRIRHHAKKQKLTAGDCSH